MYGISSKDDVSVLDRIDAAVQDFWPGISGDQLGYGGDDVNNQLSMMIGTPVFTLLANYVNDERAALAIHKDDRVVAQRLNKDTLSEEWGEFINAQMKEYE